VLLCSEFHSLFISAWTTLTGCPARPPPAADGRIRFLSEKVVCRASQRVAHVGGRSFPTATPDCANYPNNSKTAYGLRS
jgi:hypothetical protein